MSVRTAPSSILTSRDFAGAPLRWLRGVVKCGLALAGAWWVCVASALCGCNSVNGYVMNESGKAYYARGDFAAARHEFERASMDSPQNANYAYNVAAAMQQQGDSMAAERMYQHAITLDPAHEPSYEGLAHLLNSEGRTSEAEQLLTAWTQTQPYIPESNIALARFQENRGDLVGAEQSLSRAMAANPKSGRANKEMGRLFRKEGRNRESAEMYGRSLNQNPYDPETQSEIAALYQSQNTSSPALLMANEMPQYDPTMTGGPLPNGLSANSVGAPPYVSSPQIPNMAPSIYPGMYGRGVGRTINPGFAWGTPATVPQPSSMYGQGQSVAQASLMNGAMMGAVDQATFAQMQVGMSSGVQASPMMAGQGMMSPNMTMGAAGPQPTLADAPVYGMPASAQPTLAAPVPTMAGSPSAPISYQTGMPAPQVSSAPVVPAF